MISIKGDEIAEMEKYYRINLLNSLGGYKSLNLIGTVNNDGISNLGLLSSVFHLGSNPPLFGLVMRPQRENNDTLRNIKLTGQYTLNNVLPEWYERAHQTSAGYAHNVSEFEACNFEKIYANGFKAPFVGEATIRIGLELQKVIDMEINGTTIVIGKVVQMLVNENVVDDDGFVDHVKAKTMAVSGLDAYYLPQLVGRLAYAKPGVEPKPLTKER